ncbi:helix-turn-helix domain-containing protein [Rhizobium sp. SAFR-030]|uniref:helix-turn-helix domain-containing protein n=1 Tax=Rhizobium sp. SAFR-030 TaxID=3387277 RepID=UPI003F81EA62
MDQVGERLKLALRIRGIRKQMAFASEIGVSESVVSRWKRGGGLSLGNAMRICETLDISMDWLLLGRGTMDLHRSPRSPDAGARQRLHAATADLPETIIEAMQQLAEAIRSAARPDRG